MNKIWIRKSMFALYLIVLIFAFQVTGCRKKNLTSKGNLTFSTDTLVFDTVFTTIGSTTKSFKFYNNDNRKIKVEQIELMGGENSPYRINVDGVSGNYFSNIELEAKDSLFVFVEVTLDPNNQVNPLIIEDSIRFRTNGIDQYVNLAAWGQDAYFHYKDLNEGTWPNDKPHVIYGYAGVDSAKTLIIQGGTKVFLHKNSLLYIYKGTLNINGSLGNEVVFQGDRLESYYSDVTGQYYGIYFQEARPSTINYAIIKNGISGIHLFDRDIAFPGYTLTMTNTIIDNCARYGVFIYSGSKVKAESCLISRNGFHSLLVLEGGDFNFNHCHLVGYGSGDGQVPTVGISNYFVQNGIATLRDINEGTITNSVIYGNQSTEFTIDTLSGTTLNFNFQFNLIKSDIIPTNSNIYQNNLWNLHPSFVNPSNGDYHYFSNSALINGASVTFPTISLVDIENHSWGGDPDIGAYELF